MKLRGLDAGGDPFDSPGEQNRFDDDVHATLFDKNGAVMIGSRIYMHLPGGDVIEFCSCERYMQYLSNPEPIDGDPCTTLHSKAIFYGPNGVCCSDDELEWGLDTYDNDTRKIKWWWRFKFSHFPEGTTYSYARIKYWKLKNGKWRPRRGRLYAATYGEYSSIVDCSRVGSWSKSKLRRKAHVCTARHPETPQAHYAVRTDQGHAYFEYPDNQTLHHSCTVDC